MRLESAPPKREFVTIVQLTTDNRQLFREYGAPQPWFGTAPEALLQGFKELDGVEIHVVSCAQRPMASPKKLAHNIWFHLLEVPKLGWLRTGYQGCIRAVRRKLRELQPDIVHGQGTERDCAISAVFGGFPNVLTIHGNMREIARVAGARPLSFHWLTARLEAIALQRSSGVLCNSLHTERLVKPLACRTWVVPNALRAPFLASPNFTTDFRTRPVFVNIGVIYPNKRQLEVLLMAEKLWEQGCDFELHFVGGFDAASPYGAQFASRLEHWSRTGRARYRGTMDTEELISCLDSADALIHAPIEEAFGLVVAEALARGLKLFATRVGGIVDIAALSQAAELFESGEWGEMATAIRNWIGRGAPRTISGGDLVREAYNPKKIAVRHIEIYREVLSTRS